MPSSRSGRQDLVLGIAAPERVLGLQRGDRVDRVGAADRLRRRLGEAEVAHLALLDQLGHRADGLLDRHLRDRRGAGSRGRSSRRRAGCSECLAAPRARTPGRRGCRGARRSAPRTLPNLVASTTSSRRPAIASPTSSSLVNGPYMSAVSRKVTPSSSARSIVAIASPSSARAVELRHPHAAESLGRDLQASAAKCSRFHLASPSKNRRRSLRTRKTVAGKLQRRCLPSPKYPLRREQTCWVA